VIRFSFVFPAFSNLRGLISVSSTPYDGIKVEVDLRPSFCPLSSVIRPLSSVIRPLSSVICHPSSVIRPLSSVFRHPSSVIRPLSSVLCHPSSVHRPPSTVHRFLLSVLCPPSSVPTPKGVKAHILHWHAQCRAMTPRSHHCRAMTPRSHHCRAMTPSRDPHSAFRIPKSAIRDPQSEIQMSTVHYPLRYKADPFARHSREAGSSMSQNRWRSARLIC